MTVRPDRPGLQRDSKNGRRLWRAASVRLVPVCLLVWACGGPRGGPGAPVDQICDTIYNALACGRAIEAYQLPRAPDGVRRSGDSLVLPLAGGGAVSFVNSDEARRGPGEASYHTYRAYYPDIGYYLVANYMYEGSQYLLVSRRTGRRQPVFGVPVISPDTQRLAVANADLVAEYTPNVLQVWHVSADSLTLEFQVEPEDWGAEDPRWIASDTLGFTRVGLCDDAPCNRPARLVQGPGGWRVASP